MSIPVKPSASCHTIRRPWRDLERGERPDCSTPALFSVQISERDERKTLSNWREGISSVNYGQTRKRGFQKTTHHRIHEKAVITRARKAADLNPQLFRGILKFILVVLVRGDLQSFAKNSKLMKNQKRSVESWLCALSISLRFHSWNALCILKHFISKLNYFSFHNLGCFFHFSIWREGCRKQLFQNSLSDSCSLG